MKMKLFTKALSLFSIASLALFFGCGSDGGETNPMKTQLGKLSQTWTIVSADLDNSGNDETAGFTTTTDFTLTISGSFDSSNPEGPYSYSVSGSRPTPSPWPDGTTTPANGGTWTFAAEPVGDTGLLLRSDGVGMEYEIVNNQLILTFTFTGDGYQGAKTAEVEGLWTFVFN